MYDLGFGGVLLYYLRRDLHFVLPLLTTFNSSLCLIYWARCSINNVNREGLKQHP